MTKSITFKERCEQWKKNIIKDFSEKEKSQIALITLKNDKELVAKRIRLIFFAKEKIKNIEHALNKFRAFSCEEHRIMYILGVLPRVSEFIYELKPSVYRLKKEYQNNTEYLLAQSDEVFTIYDFYYSYTYGNIFHSNFDEYLKFYELREGKISDDLWNAKWQKDQADALVVKYNNIIHHYQSTCNDKDESEDKGKFQNYLKSHTMWEKPMGSSSGY